MRLPGLFLAATAIGARAESHLLNFKVDGLEKKVDSALVGIYARLEAFEAHLHQTSKLEALVARVEELEQTLLHPKQQGDVAPEKMRRALLQDESGDDKCSTRVDSSSVQARHLEACSTLNATHISVESLDIRGQIRWHGSPVGFDVPTAAPSDTPTLIPFPAPTRVHIPTPTRVPVPLPSPRPTPQPSPAPLWITVFSEAPGVNPGDTSSRTLHYPSLPSWVSNGGYEVEITWPSNQITFTVPAGSNIFRQSGSTVMLPVASFSATANPWSAETFFFCHACNEGGTLWGDTCWALLPVSSKIYTGCGCNSGSWTGWGFFYGGYSSGATTCGPHGGGFAGLKTNGQEKGGIYAGITMKIRHINGM